MKKVVETKRLEKNGVAFSSDYVCMSTCECCGSRYYLRDGIISKEKDIRKICYYCRMKGVY